MFSYDLKNKGEVDSYQIRYVMYCYVVIEESVLCEAVTQGAAFRI